MNDLPPVAQRWLDQLTSSTRSIDSLVAEGFQGCSLLDLLPWLDGGQGSFSGLSASSSCRGCSGRPWSERSWSSQSWR